MSSETRIVVAERGAGGGGSGRTTGSMLSVMGIILGPTGLLSLRIGGNTEGRLVLIMTRPALEADGPDGASADLP